MEERSNTNARVSVAVLGNKIDNLTKVVEIACVDMHEQVKRCTEVEKCIAVLKNDFDNLDEKVDNMDDRYKKINVATSVGAAIAFVLAALGFKPGG